MDAARRARIEEAFSSRHHCIIYDSPIDGITALGLLREKLKHIESSSWDERLAFGGVFVNGIALFEDSVLPCPAKVEYYEPKFSLDEAHTIYESFDPRWIVWSDPSLVIACKPSRLPTVPAKEQIRFNLRRYLEDHFGQTLHFPSRLDMSTQGLVIASRDPRMHGPLQQLFETRTITKRYLFFTNAQPDFSEVAVDAPIGKSAHHPVLREPHGRAAKSAVTTLRVLGAGVAQSGQCSLPGHFIEAIPRTGRTHQIRVHAKARGCSIAGDRFYDGAQFAGLCLMSYRLTFIHPFTDELVDVTVPARLWPAWARDAQKWLVS